MMRGHHEQRDERVEVMKDMTEITVTRTGPERFGVQVTEGDQTTPTT
jgi:hypothetical protein